MLRCTTDVIFSFEFYYKIYKITYHNTTFVCLKLLNMDVESADALIDDFCDKYAYLFEYMKKRASLFLRA